MNRVVRSWPVLGCLIFLGFVRTADAQPAAAPRWEAFANCAAAYQANWRHRLSDPGRTPDMSTMIRDESEQYRLTAMRFYQKEKNASADEASRNVSTQIDASVEGFIAMDKAGTLEAYIDMCPQHEDPN